jgi:hypothetical protein
MRANNALIMPAEARLPTKFAWLHHLLHDNARRYAGPAAPILLPTKPSESIIGKLSKPA